ncbi:MAG TPA: hypothetical protein P5137_13320 [Candidatus Brocadiia bacterium]|nr:hypothetical protein [Candidatus Brocadiia bacterium]
MSETQAVMTPPVEVEGQEREAGGDVAPAGAEGQGVGIVADLAALPTQTLIGEAALAKMLHRHPISLKRAVTRGELPQPTRLLGAPCWTVGAILGHVEKRLAQAQAQAEKDRARISKLCP